MRQSCEPGVYGICYCRIVHCSIHITSIKPSRQHTLIFTLAFCRQLISLWTWPWRLTPNRNPCMSTCTPQDLHLHFVFQGSNVRWSQTLTPWTSSQLPFQRSSPMTCLPWALLRSPAKSKNLLVDSMAIQPRNTKTLNRDPYIIHLNIATCKWFCFQLYFGLETASHVSNGKATWRSSKEPC